MIPQNSRSRAGEEDRNGEREGGKEKGEGKKAIEARGREGNRAGLTTRLTRLQPRAPTAQGPPRELRDSYSPGCTFNLATLKIAAVLL